MLPEVLEPQRPRLLDQQAEDAAPAREVPDAAVRGLVDAGRDEALELLPRLVEHPDRGVARAGDLARHVEQLLQDGVDVELRGEDAAAGVDQAPEARLVERGLGHDREGNYGPRLR